MPADPVLVVDAGTSALRAVAVTPEGVATAVAQQRWSIFTPPDAEPFGREFDAPATHGALLRLFDAASAHSKFAAVAFTGQREGIAFLDDRGDAILVSPNIDARASAEGMEIDARHQSEVYATTGHLPSLMQASAKLAWLRDNRPREAARVRTIIPLSDWLASTLTGTPIATRTLLAENGLLDLLTGDVPEALLELLGVERAFVPPPLPDGAIAGAVTSGPLAGLPVVLAGADTQCALLGMAAVSAADAAVPAGWSAPVQLVTERPTVDCDTRTWTGFHVVPGRYVLESNAGETGRAWQWTCDLCGLDPDSAQCLAGQSPPGARDVMAVLGARAMNAAEMNAGVGGITLPLPLVMSSAGRADVLRSVLESTAYAIRANLEQLEEISGVHADTLRLGGGMSQSRIFSQIVADVLGRPVDLASTSDTTAVGAAILALLALGAHPSLEVAADAMTHRSTVVTPDPRRAADYDDWYARWCAMSEAFARLAAEA